MYDKFEKREPFALLDTSKYPPEVAGRFNSFITTQFDDSLSVEMQMRSIIKWAIDNFKDMDQTYNDFTEYILNGNINPFIEMLNDLIEYMNYFISEIDNRLAENIGDILNVWLADGTLADIINNDVFDMKANQIDLEETNAQLAQTANLNKAKFYKNPIDESFPVKFTVYKDNGGKVITDIHNINELLDMPTTDTGVYYAAPSPFGDNNNDGLTPETPMTLAKAKTMEGVHTIFLRGGLYARGQVGGRLGVVTNDKLKLIAYQNEPVFVGHSEVYTNWEQHSTGIYKIERSATRGVYDSAIFDKYGNDYKYNEVNSINELNTTEGAWYTDDAMVYIRTLNGRLPDDKIKLSISGRAAQINNSSGRYYFEGITFENGHNSMFVESANIVYFKNCHFRNSIEKALELGADVHIAIMEDCMAYGSQTNDGISYRNGVGYFLEINCLGFDNGKESDINNNNGSTSHGLTGYGIRVNGLYFANKGPNVADVFGTGNDSLIWNVGCTAYGSTSTSDSSNYDFMTTDKTYWEDCVSYGSVRSFGSTEKVSYIRNSIYEQQPRGLIEEY